MKPFVVEVYGEGPQGPVLDDQRIIYARNREDAIAKARELYPMYDNFAAAAIDQSALTLEIK